jgi:diaminohydroxyphosphoribosylaminopyrimidine deaminase / 5-amino-6-(5-phosphoribosylamino)uracil reductase
VTFSGTDHRHMARALELAVRGLYTTDPNPRVGCVLVRGEEVVGEGWHERAGLAHAEVEALAQAGARARGATAYVTLEPCAHQGRTAPCVEALIAAGVERVVYAGPDPNPLVNGQGHARLAAAGIAVAAGCLRAAAEALNPGFLMRLRSGRPYVRVKLAASLDGRTALADGTSQWITGAAARADGQRLRARSSAVLTGAGTLLRDDPRLDVRTEAALGVVTRQPLRVVLAGRRALPAAAKVFASPGNCLLVAPDGGAWATTLASDHVAVVTTPADAEGRVPLAVALELLARREVNELLVEAGATLAGAFVAAGLCDELVLYLAPCLLGPDARPLLGLPALASLAERARFRCLDRRQVGEDWRLTLTPVGGGQA